MPIVFVFRNFCTYTVYPKKYAHGFCFAVHCCGYTLTDFPISIRLTSLALWQSNDCPSASKATLMNMNKYFMWIHYEQLHNHNKAKRNKTVCIFLGIYCMIKVIFQIKVIIHYHSEKLCGIYFRFVVVPVDRIIIFKFIPLFWNSKNLVLSILNDKLIALDQFISVTVDPGIY